MTAAGMGASPRLPLCMTLVGIAAPAFRSAQHAAFAWFASDTATPPGGGPCGRSCGHISGLPRQVEVDHVADAGNAARGDGCHQRAHATECMSVSCLRSR